MKGRGSTSGVRMILFGWSDGGETGILGVAVKCVDIKKKTRGEGGFLDIY